MNPIVILVRVIVPLLILVFPLVGGLFAIYLDGWDWHNRFLLGIAPIGDYQLIDKFLDFFYLILFFIVSYRLKNRFIRNILFILFFYRVIGIVLFELTQIKWLLFVFPNVFENFFFFYYIMKTIASYEPKISYRTFLFFLFAIGLPKILDEYLMHIIEKPFLQIEFDWFYFIYQWPNYGIIFLVGFSVLCGLFYRMKKMVRKKGGYNIHL